MNTFNKRFFVLIALIFLGFSAITLYFKNLIFFAIFLVFLVAFFLICSKSKQKSKNFKLILYASLFAAVFGVICSSVLVIRNDIIEEKYKGEHTFSGYIAEVSSNQSFMSEYVVRVEAVDYQRANFDLILVTEYQSDLSRGDFIEIRGNLELIEGYGDWAYLKNRNVYDYPLVCSIDESVEIKSIEGEFRIPLLLTNLNSKLSSTLKAVMGREGGSLASALLLGNRELLSDNVLRDFKRAGVYHMLALSGLHVAILIGVFDWLLKKLFVPRGIRIAILTILSFFYVALTGFALSACRAMLMLWVMYLSLTLGRIRDAMTALFAAVSVIAVINPAAILDIGLQLSFLSTFGVICASIISEKVKWFVSDINGNTIRSIMKRLLKKVLLLMISSLCVFVMTLPIIMIYFGEVSLASFITNLFMGIICEIFMIFSLVALLLSWSPFLRFPFAEISANVGEIMNGVVEAIADIDGIMLSLNYPRTEFLVFGLLFSFLILLFVRLSRKWIICIPCIAFAILFSLNAAVYINSKEGFVRAEYLAGDSMIISSSDEVYICDMSQGAYGSFYDSVEIARENCFTEIDGVVLTHYHSKHIVSVERLVKSHKIRRVLMPIPQNSDEELIMRSIIRVIESEGVEAMIYDTNRELDLLSGKLKISPRAYMSGYAHPSIAISFKYGDERITLLGRPYFDTYLESSGVFKQYIKDSDYLIFGEDGRDPKNSFAIFSELKEGCEVSFSDFDLMNKSDFEVYLDQYMIYFDVEYKKYDLK